MKKTAIVLFNLGGPDSLSAVKPFLFNLFSDPAIITLPQPFRYLIAKMISSRRTKTAQKIYAQMGGRSPILKNTEIQALALEKALVDLGRVRCFVSMSYWHPFAVEAVQQVKDFAPDDIVLLPLFPQFSTTTVGASLRGWFKAANKTDIRAPMKTICCYPDEPGFIAALAASARTAYFEVLKATGQKPRILFSAHGLPEKIIKAGDPYQFQCERTVTALRTALAVPDLDSVLCYQSRVGPLKWISPSTGDEILRAGHDKVPVVVLPVAFVSEHSETLVEIDIEYRHLAEKSGVPYFAYAPTVGVNPDFIGGLGNLVRQVLTSEASCISSSGERLCPTQFSGCTQIVKQIN